MVGVVVGIAFAVRKRHAVVGGHDHDRVLEFPPLLQLGEHSPQVKIEIFHLERVIEHVVAHLLGVRPTCGHAINIGDLLVTLSHAGTIFITTVWLMTSIPEGPRLPLGCSIQEVVEIPCIISPRHSLRDLGGKIPLLKRLSRHLALLACSILGDTWPPALASHSDKVTLLAQRFLVGFELGWKNGPVVARLLQLPGIAAGNDTRS